MHERGEGCQDEKVWHSSEHISCPPRRDGRALSDDEIAGMLIGLLLAGQHTSSTTSAWMGFFMAKDKALQERCYAEQKAACGEDLPPLNLDQVNSARPVMQSPRSRLSSLNHLVLLFNDS